MKNNWRKIGFRGDSYTFHCEHERLLHQDTLLRICRAACVRVCACVYPECSRLEDSTTLSRCSAPQLRRNESFSFSLDSIVTCTHQHVSQEAPLHYPRASYIVIFTFFSNLVACEYVFDENSFSLMETLVDGSMLRPVKKTVFAYSFLHVCIIICEGIFHFRRFVKFEKLC